MTGGTTPDLGPWEPLPLEAAVALFAGAPFRWWISGGVALELHVGRSWRPHDDTDAGICRQDVSDLHDVLDGWDVHVAAAGTLRPWRGEPLDAERHENNLWCRRSVGAPWEIDMTIGEGDADRWVYRRDPTVHLAWDEAVLADPHGVPYLAPEIQLLFKAKGLRAKDDTDAREVVPILGVARRDRLRTWLPRDHPWQELLAAAR
jgi:hypothetical protein